MKKIVFLLALIVNIIPVLKHGEVTINGIGTISAQGYGSEDNSGPGITTVCAHEEEVLYYQDNVSCVDVYRHYYQTIECGTNIVLYDQGFTDFSVTNADCVQAKENIPDCHGDYGGTAYIDKCKKCVGGNTGAVDCNKIINKLLCSDFEDIINKIFNTEKGFWNDPVGGYTNLGIKWSVWQSTAEKYLGEEPTLANLENLTKDKAEIIYRGAYWNIVSAEQINDGDIRYAMVDFFINAYGNAVLTMQRTLNQLGANVEEDSGMGPQTINAINQADPVLLYNSYNQNRMAFYNNLCTNTKISTSKRNQYSKNLNGWRNRVNSFKAKTNNNKYNVNCN